jgi:alkylhydroperoxidase family enzyme
MPRLRQVSRADAAETVIPAYDALFPGRDPVAEPGTATGTRGDWWTVFALVPDVLAHAQAGFALLGSRKRALAPQHRELALTRAGFVAGSQFVFSQHCKAARRAGTPEEKIAAVPYWTIAEVFTPTERAVLAFVDGMILEGGRVHDRVIEALKAALPDDHILMLTYFVNMYALHATATKALRLEYDDVPERVVEIPAPEGHEVQNWRDPIWAERAAG